MIKLLKEAVIYIIYIVIFVAAGINLYTIIKSEADYVEIGHFYISDNIKCTVYDYKTYGHDRIVCNPKEKDK